jgi:hypothetical protein
MRLILSGVLMMVFLPAAIAAAGTANLNGAGELVSVTGLVVGTETYDVTFDQGTCIDVFTGCDSAVDDFAFTGGAEAVAAAVAFAAFATAAGAPEVSGVGTAAVFFLLPYGLDEGEFVEFIIVTYAPLTGVVGVVGSATIPVGTDPGDIVGHEGDGWLVFGPVPVPAVPSSGPLGLATLIFLMLIGLPSLALIADRRQQRSRLGHDG